MGIPIEYLGLRERPASTASSVIKIARLLFTYGAHTLQWLAAQPIRPAAVILYGGYSPYLLRLLPWCAQQRVPLIADIVEWYDNQHIPGGPWGPFRLNYGISMRYLYPKVQGVIAISTFLDNYYQRDGCTTIRIPPTVDTQQVSVRQREETNTRLQLVYAGTPGKKDLLAEIIQGILLVDPKMKHSHLNVIGPTPEQVCKLLGTTKLPDNIAAFGRVMHNQVIDMVRQADFSVLLRPPNKRYAQAGFPTKVVESLAVGTPVICNLTSDLGEYIHDGQEGVICADYTPEALNEALQRILAMPRMQWQIMRQAARSRAEVSFDYRNYISSIKSFMEEILL